MEEEYLFMIALVGSVFITSMLFLVYIAERKQDRLRMITELLHSLLSEMRRREIGLLHNGTLPGGSHEYLEELLLEIQNTSLI